jgi:hypothetical protein
MTVAKSANTWFQLPLETKIEYKSKLIQLHRCHKRKTMNIDNKGRAFEFAARHRISEKAVYLQVRSNRIRSFYTENLPQKLLGAGYIGYI